MKTPQKPEMEPSQPPSEKPSGKTEEEKPESQTPAEEGETKDGKQHPTLLDLPDRAEEIEETEDIEEELSSNHPLKILVTGGAGFIGSHVVDAYVGAGHEVTVIDDFSTGFRGNLNPKARLIEMDICDGDNQPLIELFEKEKFDVVNHHAADPGYSNGFDDPIFNADSNITGTVAVLDACVRTGVKKLIFASSWKVYDSVGLEEEMKGLKPVIEHAFLHPCSPEGLSKYSAELYIKLFSQRYPDLEYTILRYANVYGPRGHGVVTNFISSLLSEKQCLIQTHTGTRGMEMDYVFVKDVAHANLVALKKGSGETLNIGMGLPIYTRSLWQQICNTLVKSGIERTIHSLRCEQASYSFERIYLDISRAGKVFMWFPMTHLKEGLKATVAHELERLKRSNGVMETKGTREEPQASEDQQEDNEVEETKAEEADDESEEFEETEAETLSRSLSVSTTWLDKKSQNPVRNLIMLLGFLLIVARWFENY